MNAYALTSCVVGVLLCLGLIAYMLAHAFRDLRVSRAKWRELRPGEAIREGDEWRECDGMWAPTILTNGTVPHSREIRYRRRVEAAR